MSLACGTAFQKKWVLHDACHEMRWAWSAIARRPRFHTVPIHQNFFATASLLVDMTTMTTTDNATMQRDIFTLPPS